MKIPFIPPLKIRVIRGVCGEPYMIRLTLFDFLGFSLKLHVFLRGDEDRELHDHPWSFWTLVIAGEYLEEIPEAQRGDHPVMRGNTAPFLPIKNEDGNVFIPRKKGSLSYRPALWSHRVHVQNPCVTLVFTTRAKREWGFHTQEGWMPWEQFIRERRKDANC